MATPNLPASSNGDRNIAMIYGGDRLVHIVPSVGVALQQRDFGDPGHDTQFFDVDGYPLALGLADWRMVALYRSGAPADVAAVRGRLEAWLTRVRDYVAAATQAQVQAELVDPHPAWFEDTTAEIVHTELQRFGARTPVLTDQPLAACFDLVGDFLADGGGNEGSPWHNALHSIGLG